MNLHINPANVMIWGKPLSKILSDHYKWIDSNYQTGERANLEGADLSNVDLARTYLAEANLKGANLTCAYLEQANLREAFLNDADLTLADLSYTNLSHAILTNSTMVTTDLCGACLFGSDLRGADMTRAILYDAHLEDAIIDPSTKILVPQACPDEGSFIGWKAVWHIQGTETDFVIVKLLIPEDALRTSATGRKCRCSKAVVLDIQDADGVSLADKNITAFSNYDPGFEYSIGSVVTPKKPFDENRWNECASGIHFFITRDEAIDYLG